MSCSLRAILLVAVALLGSPLAHAACDFDVYNALLAFYKSTHGEYWHNNSGWSDGDTYCCKWFGITCDATETRILSLRLSGNNLNSVDTLGPDGKPLPRACTNDVGRPPPPSEVCLLAPNLYGQPPNLLAHLQNLDLSNNSLTGDLGQCVSAWTELEYLNLGHNQFTGLACIQLPQPFPFSSACQLTPGQNVSFALPVTMRYLNLDAAFLCNIWINLNYDATALTLGHLNSYKTWKRYVTYRM